MLHAVIFDMDDTLIDWSEHDADWTELRREYLRPVVEHLLEQGWALPPLDVVVTVYSDINRMAWESSTPPEWIAPRQYEVLRRTLAELDLNVEQLDLIHLQHLFAWGPMPGVRVFPDTFDVLDTIRACGVQIGLMTNSSSPMWMRDRELEAMGLLQYLDVRLTAGDVGHLKPHRRAFEAVLDQLDTQPEDAVFVGDRQHDDIVGAQQVGMRAVWVKRGTESAVEDIKPDATIEALSELPPRLDEWFPGWRYPVKGATSS